MSYLPASDTFDYMPVAFPKIKCAQIMDPSLVGKNLSESLVCHWVYCVATGGWGAAVDSFSDKWVFVYCWRLPPDGSAHDLYCVKGPLCKLKPTDE